MRRLLYHLRGHVDGAVIAPLVVYKSKLSFYGEVNREAGKLPDGRSFKGRILVIPGTKGSTVAPYVLLSLSKRGTAPQAIVAGEAEPMLITGAVLAGIPLASGLRPAGLEELDDECWCHLVVKGAFARMTCVCP